jgi:ABC-type nitrate/sulfonate/bicarbonate transport system permease component
MIRTFSGFAIGSTLGVILGFTIALNQGLREALEPVADFFRSIPVVALFPLFVVLFGFGDWAKVATATWSTAPVVLVSALYGVIQSNATRIQAVKNLGASRAQIFTKVLVWEALPNLVAGARTGFSMSLIVIIVTEMFLGTHYGLGRLIYDAGIIYDTPRMYAGIFLTGMIGYSSNRLLIAWEKKIIHWTGK